MGLLVRRGHVATPDRVVILVLRVHRGLLDRLAQEVTLGPAGTRVLKAFRGSLVQRAHKVLLARRVIKGSKGSLDQLAHRALRVLPVPLALWVCKVVKVSLGQQAPLDPKERLGQ